MEVQERHCHHYLINTIILQRDQNRYIVYLTECTTGAFLTNLNRNFPRKIRRLRCDFPAQKPTATKRPPARHYGNAATLRLRQLSQRKSPRVPRQRRTNVGEPSGRVLR